ncbi:MAG: hypothetical protein WCH98_01645 [Verrucomicrobiota bacterium]
MKNKYLGMISLHLALLAGAYAETVFKEDFSASSETENASAVDGATTWTSRGSRPLLGVVGDTEGLKSGSSLKISKGFVYATFPDVTLNEGDALELSFRYRFAQPPQETGFPLRLGLYNATSGNPADGLSPGYWFMTNPAAEGGKSMVVYEEGTDGSPGGGSDFSALQDLFPGPAAGTTVSTFKWTILRSSGGSVDIATQTNDDAPVTRTDQGGKVTTFNAFAISIASMVNSEFLIDDIALNVIRKDKK